VSADKSAPQKPAGISAGTPSIGPAGLFRRLGAALYDGLLLIALMMIVTACLLPLTHGEAITVRAFGMWAHAYQLLLLLVIFGFFGFFWTRKGQTLGMAAWRLHLERDSGGAVTWGDTAKRLLAACLSWAIAMLGYLWVLVDRDKRTWHDRLTHTRVVVLPKKKL
jgi:uncharacterized RDD family membrane protein YckC